MSPSTTVALLFLAHSTALVVFILALHNKASSIRQFVAGCLYMFTVPTLIFLLKAAEW